MKTYDTPEQFHEAFETAQCRFDGRIEETDFSQAVVDPDTNAEAAAQLTDEPSDALGFHEVVITTEAIQRGELGFLNRILLMRGADPNVLSPVIFTADPGSPNKLQLSRLEVPYVPSVGVARGLHWAISTKAQTRLNEFGRHGHNGGFEPGHFSGAVAGSRNAGLARDLIRHGDKASHAVIGYTVTAENTEHAPPPKLEADLSLLGSGVPDAMAALDLVEFDIKSHTLIVDPSRPVRLQAFWHPTLEGVDGPISGDYPEAVKLMQGAAIKELGDDGLDRMSRLVEAAVRGAM